MYASDWWCDKVLAAAQSGHQLLGVSLTIGGGFLLRSVLDMVWGIVFGSPEPDPLSIHPFPELYNILFINSFGACS